MQHLPLSQISNTSTKFNSPKSLFFYSFLGNSCETINGRCSILKGKLIEFQNKKTSLSKARPKFQSKNSWFGHKVKCVDLASSCTAEHMEWWAVGCAVASEGTSKHRKIFLGCLGCLWELQSESDSPAQLESFTPSEALGWELIKVERPQKPVLGF